MKKKIECRIIETVAVLSRNENTKWSKELNFISWNGDPAKYDIRDWNQDHTKCNKGATITEREARVLMTALAGRLKGVTDNAK